MISKKWRLYVILHLFISIPSILSALEHLSVSFYSEVLQIQYDPTMVVKEPVAVEENRIVRYYQLLKKSNYRPLLDQLQSLREKMELNDWLYFELMRKSIGEIFRQDRELEQELAIWLLLAESGFDVRLAYVESMVFLYVSTLEELYEVPLIEEAGKSFASLSSLAGKRSESLSLFLLHFVPNPQGRPFSFSLHRLPKLTPEAVEKSYSIPFRDTIYQISFLSDRTIFRLMQNYPLIAENQYFKVPFSTIAAQSLIPKLRLLIADKSESEAVELLVAFTRSSFQYLEDKVHFGFSKPMIPEEVFHYPYSDCEDRCALFFSLVKELLELPMIIVAFKDHLTIGVALKDIKGDPINYLGRKYYICDPTGPANSTRIGFFPKGYETKPFDIIGDSQ